MTMKNSILLSLIVLFANVLSAQNQFSYVSDRIFLGPDDLIGYNFKPFRMEIKDDREENLTAGSVAFGITQTNLYVTGKDIEGVYSINNINTTNFGFQLSLMNARNPTLQGHLKIILNRTKQVEAVIFKRSAKEKEVIYHIAKLNEDQRNKELAYFTDKGELIIDSPDSLLSKTIFPMTVIFAGSGIQDKFAYSDSVMVKFETKTTVIEKIIKEKKKKEKPVKIKEEKEEKKKEKPKKEKKKEPSKNKNEDEDEEETIKVDAKKEIIEGDDEEEDDTDVKKSAEKKNLEVEEEEEEEEEDPVKKPEEIKTVENEDEADEETITEEPKKKIKITKENFATVRYMVKFEDGKTEKEINTFKISKLSIKEDKESTGDDEKFQITVTPASGSPFYIYLNADKSVNSIELKDRKMFVRGN